MVIAVHRNTESLGVRRSFWWQIVREGDAFGFPDMNTSSSSQLSA